MKKAAVIAWKDLIMTYRDPAALVLMLVTPFALTLAMVFALGGSDGGSVLTDIPFAVVNRDAGDLGAELVAFFESDDLAELLAPERMDSPEDARARVDADELAAAVILQEDFSDIVLAMPEPGASATAQTARIEVYGNPTRTISTSVVRGLVEAYLSRLTTGVVAAEVTLGQLLETGRLNPQDGAALGRTGEQLAREAAGTHLIELALNEADLVDEDSAGGFDWLAYMAPSMAMFFLLFTVTAGGRSILTERDGGTLPRMLTTPTTAAQVLGGKIFGTFLTGLGQMAILILASTLLFDMQWGSPLAVGLLVLAVVAAATSWGLLIAAFARSPAQAGVVGTAVTLVFGILAGSFFPRPTMPEWLQSVSLITPNAWGLEAFFDLGTGAGLAEVVIPLLALTGMAAAVFTVALMAFRRQYS